jgi:hypothetical protein
MSLKLAYRAHLQLAKQFPTKSLRDFAKRRIREDFRDPACAQFNPQDSLEMMQRCIVVQQLTFKEDHKTLLD